MKVKTTFCNIKAMKFNKYFKKFTFLSIILFSTAIFSLAQIQNFPAPRENKLLNGTKILVWSNSKAEKVVVKLRIHSGSAFDPLGKEGTMRLLSDILFPNESIKEFFTDDLGGSFEIVSNYDYIQINTSGDSDKFLTILETLATAVTNPQINKETTEKVRGALLTKVRELEKNPSYIADQAVAKRLLGNFPYGRPQLGSSESIQQIDFADMLLAEQKFLTADNATIAISGNVNADFAFRATKRLFGGWLKSDKKIPATFAQPEIPKSGLPIFESPIENKSEFRLAFRGLARNDKDFYASMVLEKILQKRFQMREGKNASVRHEAHILPSLFIFGVSDWNLGSIKKEGNKIAVPITDGYQNDYLKEPIKSAEFDEFKAKYSDDLNNVNLSDFWLDAETFKLSAVKTELQNAQNVTVADVQRVLERLQKESAATILVFKDKNSDTSSNNQE